MDSHVIEYKIHGDDMQVVSIELDPNETVIAEAGSMNWMDRGISFEAKMGDGTEPDSGIMGKLFSVGKRVLTGCLLYTSPSPRDRTRSRMPSSA